MADRYSGVPADKGGYMGSGLSKVDFIVSWIGIFVCIGIIVFCGWMIYTG